MNPLVILGLLGAAGAAFMFFKKEPSISEEERGRRMATMADIIYRLSIHQATAAERATAVVLAKYFKLPLTATGVNTPGGALPTSEKWPGSNLSVAAYMTEYARQRKPSVTPPKAPQKSKYNDETPVAPFEDPRKVRAQATAEEAKGNKAAAAILHKKADTLNKLIRAKKTGTATAASVSAAANALKSLIPSKK